MPPERARLAEGAAELGVELDGQQLDALLRYVDLLLEWNAKLNLTAITDRPAIVEKHLLDCLAVVPCVLGRRVIDVGTGAGLPSVMLAIARPELEVVAVESIHKKVSFVRAVSRELKLPIVVHAERLERLSCDTRFDFAVSRATFAPAEWIQRSSGLVGRPGRLAAMLSSQQEVPPPPSGFAAASLRPYEIDHAPRRIALYDAL